MKNVMFWRIRGVRTPSRKGRGAVATALVAASGVAALAFAPSAQAAGSYNVMLTKVPAGVKSVLVYEYNGELGAEVGCFTVQSGRDKNTGYKISNGNHLTGDMYSDSTCSSGRKGSKKSAPAYNLSTTNFWFDLS